MQKINQIPQHLQNTESTELSPVSRMPKNRFNSKARSQGTFSLQFTSYSVGLTPRESPLVERAAMDRSSRMPFKASEGFGWIFLVAGVD